MNVTVAPGSITTSKTSASRSMQSHRPDAGARRQHLDAFIAKIGAEKCRRPGSRKNGATSRRSSCTSLSLRSANSAQFGLVPCDARQHFDPADNAVFAGRRGQLDLALAGPAARR